MNYKKQRNGIQKFPLKFDITMLNAIIGYSYKNTSQINRKCLLNLRNLFDRIDEEVYSGNPKMEARFNFIKKTLQARVEKKFDNLDMVLNYCRPDVEDEYVDEVIENLEEYMKLNYDEIKYITKAVEDRLKFMYLFIYKDRIYETVERLDSGDYTSYEEINSELTEICRDVVQKTREIQTQETCNTFALTDDMFETGIEQIVKSLTEESKILRTGIKHLNELLSGGYHSKRLYMYMALPANFKSGILLKSARDIKKYNKGLKTKTGNRPTVLMVTCENDVIETIERLFSMVASNDDIRKFTPKQVIDLLRTEGEMVVDDADDIDIVIKYFPNHAISTDDLYAICDDLLDEGKEVIALVLDYIKRIRPARWTNDEKEQLKNVTNELKNLAVELDIPVISATQLNRAGASTIDQAQLSGKEDLARFIGRSNVGSAWEIQENADFACIINLEEKKDTGQFYLTFKRTKIRYKPTQLTYFNHPFALENRMRLLDDLHLPQSLSEESLGSDLEGVTMDEMIDKQKSRKYESNMITEEDDDNGIFNFGSALNKIK